MNRRTHEERIDEEASLWAARLEGGAMGEDDRAALSAWLEADREHRTAFERYGELSAQLDAQLAATLESMAVMKAVAQKRRRRFAAVAFATIAAAAVLIVVWLGRSRDLTTMTAERHVTALADGTRVELNAQTALAVDFRRDERHVRLLRGEAFFSVAKDAARPFVVETPAGFVRVTGTVFNVRAAQTQLVEVTVLEGTVRVRAPGAAAIEEPVTAGLQAVLTDDKVAVRTLLASAAEDAVAWRHGQAVFDDTPLREAIERFSAYHATKIIVDPAAADLRLGGRYSLEDLDGWLESIESVLPVRVSHDANGSVRITATQPRAR